LPEKEDLQIGFWGVRGGIACPGQETIRYGGNTACLMVSCADHKMIFDAGTGIRALGAALIKQSPVSADIFFSRTSFERICGIPFFAAGYHPDNAFRFWGDHKSETEGVRDALAQLMSDPVFPVPIDIMSANLVFTNFNTGETLRPADGISITTVALNKSVPVTGYRIDWRGKSIAYASDLIHGEEGDETAALKLLDGADMAILNTARHTGRDTTWLDGIALCDAANVTTCVLYHHNPDNDDDAMDAITAEAESRRPGTVVAREGMVLTV
jgi:phosphoribosyl 1,2-cyclic phosphodiesterase